MVQIYGCVVNRGCFGCDPSSMAIFIIYCQDQVHYLEEYILVTVQLNVSILVSKPNSALRALTTCSNSVYLDFQFPLMSFTESLLFPPSRLVLPLFVILELFSRISGIQAYPPIFVTAGLRQSLLFQSAFNRMVLPDGFRFSIMPF